MIGKPYASPAGHPSPRWDERGGSDQARYARGVLRPDDVEEIARAYALGDGAALTGTVARGELGQVWQLTTSRGTWAAKTSFEPLASVDEEDAEFQSAAISAGVPAPAVVRSVDGAILVDVGGVHVRVYGWVDVLPPDRDLDPVEVGRLMAAIHRIPFDGRRPEDPWYTKPVGAAGWDDLIERLAAVGAPFATDLAALRDELVAREAVLEPARALRTCHRDLWADNLRATHAGGMCVIDWDNCGLADPGQEVAVALFEFGSNAADRARDLYREYRRCGGPGRVAKPGDFSMAIAQLGHIDELSCRRWLDPETAASDREHAAARLTESLAEPLTLHLIDGLLDAVSG
jgi:aminoglycoside phosphotransferase (APT) family kinase protein